MNNIIPLDRRFVPWTTDESNDDDVLAYLSEMRDKLGWDDLLQRRRVVVLAEPGSGKSAEIEAQVECSRAAGNYTFVATVQTIGRIGLTRALGNQDAHQLEAWRQSDKPAWFFFDAVDEAKAGNVPFDDALREMANGIEGCRGRAHIILTGRDTNWEIRRDLDRILKHLAMPPADVPPPAVDPNDLVVAIIRRERADDDESIDPAESPLVVRMVPLDSARIETFARTKNVTDSTRFLSAIDKSDLWTFASRPIDLDWLVDYWVAHDKFGTLCEMLTLSIRNRLRETNPDRDSQDTLDADQMLEALERIGAALVLQRLRDIEVPDGASNLDSGVNAAKLVEILPDWTGVDRSKLISRAIFVPASAGYVRLHNDNEGAVSGFLAARWSCRLMSKNCPKAEINDLLFSTTYGLALVIPSMRNTAAWLSLWNPDISRQVVECDPRLLMDAGDPGSLSLDIREQALRSVVEQIVVDEYVEIPNRESVKRFGQADMQACVRGLWSKYESSPTARELLLMMIWHGDLDSCSDLAINASFGAYSDRYTPMFAGNALMATANKQEKRRYAEYVRDNAGHCSAVVTWDAVRALFPTLLTIDDLLQILEAIDVADEQGGLGFDYYGPKLVDKLESAADIQHLLEGLMAHLDAPVLPLDEIESKNDEQYHSSIEAAGRRLLELTKANDAPDVAIDAALRLGEIYRSRGPRRRHEGQKDLLAILMSSPERRRLMLWRAAELFKERPRLKQKPITGIWRFRLFGFIPDLKADDFDWLLHDTEHRTEANERQIAADAAMTLWKWNDQDPQKLARLQALGTKDEDVAAVIAEWTTPREPSQEDFEHDAEMAALDQRHKKEREERDQSWRDFADEVRANPQRLREAKSPSKKGVDSWLYSMWQLLNGLGENHSHYAISDLAPLVPIFGPVAVEALREALIAYWRHWSPTLSSERPPEKQNSIHQFDCIGIVGVTLEADSNPDWAKQLSHKEAVRAAVYAMNELNGFPAWIVALTKDQPGAVREVLLRAMALECETLEEGERFAVLSDVARSDAVLASTVAANIHDLLVAHQTIAPAALTSMWQILTKGFDDRGALEAVAAQRFNETTDWGNAASHLAALYDLNAKAAIDLLVSTFSTMDAGDQTALMQVVLSSLFGRWEGRAIDTETVPFSSLLTLVRIAYRTVRREDDIQRPSGACYSPTLRDDAESARGMLLSTLFDTPGLATFKTIQTLGNNADIGLPQDLLTRRARERALLDSEHGVWSSADVVAFEKVYLTAPHTSRDLQQLAIRRLNDLDYDLTHSDFAPGSLLAALPHETDVQKWIADRLRSTQGRNYSVEREVHLAGEKEPDIRFEAKASNARVQLEIKVAESWTLNDLEDALHVQLIAQYLRDRVNYFGVLLLLHQKSRPKGWRSEQGDFWDFPRVVEHLRMLARAVAVEAPDAPQVEVVVIDVSSHAAKP